MLGYRTNMPKRKIQDLVDEILKEIEEKSAPDRLGAATSLRKQIMCLGLIVEAWRMWTSDVVILDLLSSEDLEKMVKDFTRILVIITPPSGHFSDIVEELDKNICNHRAEDEREEIRIV